MTEMEWCNLIKKQYLGILVASKKTEMHKFSFYLKLFICFTVIRSSVQKK